MCLYIIYAQMLVYFKETCGELDYNDPFVKLIVKSKDDFLGNNNFILICFTVQVYNIQQIIYMSLYYFDIYENFKLQNLACMIINFLLVIIFCSQVWDGTKHEQFFTKKYLGVLGFFYFIFLAANLLLLANNFNN